MARLLPQKAMYALHNSLTHARSCMMQKLWPTRYLCEQIDDVVGTVSQVKHYGVPYCQDTKVAGGKVELAPFWVGRNELRP